MPGWFCPTPGSRMTLHDYPGRLFAVGRYDLLRAPPVAEPLTNALSAFKST
jgi:hypothetical protein